MTAREHFRAPDGTLLTYRDFGEGRPLVLFAGDSDDTADLWLPHVDPLVARGHRVILVDLPDERSPARAPTAAGLALLDHLDTADDPAGYDLGGHGVGALLVVRMVFAGATPHRVIVAGLSVDVASREELGRLRASMLVLTTPGPDGQVEGGLNLTVPDFASPQVVAAISGFFDATPVRPCPPRRRTRPADDAWPRRPWSTPIGAVVEHDGPVTRVHYGTHGTVEHPDLTGVDLSDLVERQLRHFADRGEPVEWKTYAHETPDLPEHLLAAGFTPGWERSVLVADEITAPPNRDVRDLRNEDLPEVRRLAGGRHRTPFADIETDGPVRLWDANVQVVLERGRVVGAGWAEPAGGGVVVIGGLTGLWPQVLAEWARWAERNSTFFAEADGELRDVLLDVGFREVVTARSYHWTPPRPPAATRPVVLQFDQPEHDEIWHRVDRRLGFRPSVRAFPGITEPPGSVTWHLNVGEDGLDELQSVVVAGLREIGGEELYWLDWQHVGYRFEPDRVGRPGQPPWPGSAYPDGDYYLYLPRDLRFGTFGHPWEHTLCVFGESLVAHVEEALNKLLGPPVRRS
ncbi:hypothetical protein F4560_006451 [Saccharothrix ecbatanensis]|uniref:Uncharacterized protein n=1 Tax=Saccharothrix ecbatanensis TaxID=1105145 RepID=A0A7W9M465_9PSEU|nr:DUF2716 domain-containing protein [Saccharothrix ecbatanensis]MBB5806683.1 hypothetical protein [Saccharothrix ecbatanensis]